MQKLLSYRFAGSSIIDPPFIGQGAYPKFLWQEKGRAGCLAQLPLSEQPVIFHGSYTVMEHLAWQEGAWETLMLSGFVPQ